MKLFHKNHYVGKNCTLCIAGKLPSEIHSIINNSKLKELKSITEKTKLSFRSGYDFKYKMLTQTSINATRDLHCWRISFSWVPFGRFQSYNLTINAVSALLQDLKLEKRSRFFDNL